LRLFRKTSGINLNNNWKKLEKKLVKYMEESFPDYNFETQKTYSGYGKRPDVYGQHKKISYKRMIGEAKCVKELTSAHVKQAKSYKKHPGYAEGGIIGIAKDTKVPHKVRQEAKSAGFKIKRLNLSITKGFWDPDSDDGWL